MSSNGVFSGDLLDGASLRGLVRETRFANLDLVPSKPDLAGTAIDGGTPLAQALAPARETYSFVFVDCPPSWAP